MIDVMVIQETHFTETIIVTITKHCNHLEMIHSLRKH